MKTKRLNHNICQGLYTKHEADWKPFGDKGKTLPQGVFREQNENGVAIQHADREFRIFKSCNQFQINGKTLKINNQRIWDITYTGNILLLAAAGKVYAVDPDDGKVLNRFPNFINPQELHYDAKTSRLHVKDREKCITLDFSDKEADAHIADDTFSNRGMHAIRRTSYLVWDILKKIPLEIRLGVKAVWETKSLVIISGIASIIAGLAGASLGSFIAETQALTGMLHGAALISGFAIGAIAVVSFLFAALTATAIVLSAERTILLY